jgi:hypothetical protein
VSSCLGRTGALPHPRHGVFTVERFCTTFGLVLRSGNEEDDAWWVELHPDNYMAFNKPLDSGRYDT